MSMTLIETKTLGTAQAAIEFTSIPEDGTDLVVIASVRNTTTGASDTAFQIRFNGSTTTYSERTLFGDGSSASSFSGTSSIAIYANNASPWTANTFGNASIYVPNYTGSTNKSVSADSVTENNGTAAHMAIVAGLWSTTSSITSVALVPFGVQTFAIGSTVSLYKITKGTDGIVVVS
jgi:hypothetical protein